MVVFPDPPFELITSVVFILIPALPFLTDPQGHRKTMPKSCLRLLTNSQGGVKTRSRGFWPCLRPYVGRQASGRKRVLRCSIPRPPFPFPAAKADRSPPDRRPPA